MDKDQTIVAISSAVGPAARMIVRTSGPAAHRLLAAMLPAAEGAEQALGGAGGGGSVVRRMLHFAGLVCPAWVYVFHSPRSYTGDDLVEYHLPGNPILAELLIRHLSADADVRAAEPGEFTARAYLNGRMDLTQAEGVAAVVSAQSQAQADAGRRLMAGELARRLARPADELLSTLALLEVGIDFSDEDVTFLPPAQLVARLDAVSADLQELLSASARFKPLGYEPTFVLVGRPNAGKSTLLNALAGYQRAVASPVAGTTRDALSAEVSLARGAVRVVDVAGIEAHAAATVVASDDIATQMETRARREIEQADFVIEVRPVDEPRVGRLCGRVGDLVVRSRADLQPAVGGPDEIPVSPMTGEGIDELRSAMDELAFGRDGSAALMLNDRHVQAVNEALQAIGRARQIAEGPVELVAAELREAIAATGSVLGEVSPDDLLGRVFAQFCIGK